VRTGVGVASTVIGAIDACREGLAAGDVLYAIRVPILGLAGQHRSEPPV
jgi:hypothetical protein